MMRNKLVFLAVLAGVVLGACGGDDPAPVVDTVPPTTTTTVAEAVTTTTTTIPPTTTTTVAAVEDPPITTTTIPPTTTTTIPPPPTTTTTLPTAVAISGIPGDLIEATVPETPDSPFTEAINGNPVTILLPGTADEVIGWTQPSDIWGWSEHGGDIDVVLDGWRVEHSPGENGPEATVSLFVTMVADPDGPPLMWLTTEREQEEGDAPVSAGWQPYIPGYSLPTGWIDPNSRKPIPAGGEQPMQFSWTFSLPADDGYVYVTVGQHAVFYIYPQDPGEWGTPHPPPPPPPAAAVLEDLHPICDHPSYCVDLGEDFDNQVGAYFFPEEKSDYAIQFLVNIKPKPTRDETPRFSSTEEKAWYADEPEQVWQSWGLPWQVAYYGYGIFRFSMPVRSEFIYLQWTDPDGRVYLWKSVAGMQDLLFSNPDWAWVDPDDHYRVIEEGVEAAVNAADRICWSYWTGKKDPYQIFPYSITVDGRGVVVTYDMITWVIDNICQQ